ncbi:cell division protein CrgA [Curtobacterium sp. S6]|uniref:cell division protein CrgA n=1 Tax=Curtobacterium sp. S6 TaxID=1479623 RepID=UPI0009EBD03B|nr:cell division protein CrgA [Curtobacterium sp. S6]
MAEKKNTGEKDLATEETAAKTSGRRRIGSRRAGKDTTPADSGEAVDKTERTTSLVADDDSAEATESPKAKKKRLSAEDERLQKIADEMTSNVRQASPTPTWYIAIMLGFMIIGLLWIMTFYISDQTLPIPDLSFWNIAVGIGLMMIGLVMTTRWR